MGCFRNVFKGLLIGAANLLPGISGGTMAIALDVYETLIEALCLCVRRPLESLKRLWPYLLGGLLGLAGVTFLVEKTLTRFPYLTILLFGGMVLGGLPAIVTKIQLKRVNIKHAIFFFLGVLLTLGMSSLSAQTPQQADGPWLILFILGFFLSLSMLIPGVSGSLILITLGYYDGLVSACRHVLSGIYQPDWLILTDAFSWLLPFGLGLGLGMLSFSKVVAFLISHYATLTYCFMLGIMLGSLWLMLKDIPFFSLSLCHQVLGMGLFVGGIECTYLLEK